MPAQMPLSRTAREALSALAEIVKAAQKQAARRGIPLPLEPEESRKLLARRIVRLIEHGETDLGELREQALIPQMP